MGDLIGRMALVYGFRLEGDFTYILHTSIDSTSFKPLSPLREVMHHKKARVARTESTRPLMADEDEESPESSMTG